MRSRFIFVFLLLPLMLLHGCATAQNFPKRTVDGKEYFVYFVEPGNTIYAISRMFSVDADAILRANPKAAEGLQVGQELLIPTGAVDRREARKVNVAVEGEYILHEVQRKETLFSISRRYGVELSDLMNLNPDKVDQLATGDTLRIPGDMSRGVEETLLEPAVNDTFIVHRVQQGETLYALSKQYGISQDSLRRANDGLPEGLQTGRYIVIPKYSESFLANREKDSEISGDDYPDLPHGHPETVHMALMLPFELEYNDSLERTLASGRDLYILSEIALEYYRGTMMALDSLRKMGLNAEVHVYDVGDDLVKARDVVRRPEMDRMHIVFGPLHKSTFAVVSEASRRGTYYLVSPNSFANEIFEDNPYLMRAQASDQTLMRYLANFVAIQHPEDNVLMVNSTLEKDWPERRDFKKYYNLAMSSFRNVHADSLRSLNLFGGGADKGSFDQEALESYMREDVKNVIVVPSGDLAFVSNFLTRLSLLDERKYDIQVYGLNEWVNYDNIEAAYKNRFKLRLVVPRFVDYRDENVIRFLEKYRAKYLTEPSYYDYGFVAFDLMMFFGEALLKEGLDFPEKFESMERHGVSGNFRFGRSMSGKEYENKAVYIIEYDDYETKRVN